MRKIITITTIFLIGLAAGMLFARAEAPGWEELPDGQYEGGLRQALANIQPIEERPSPKDRVDERQIEVYGNRIILDVQNAQWAKFTDTKSMEPILTAQSNAIELEPEDPEDIQVGDIVSYRSDYTDGWIIHRVVHKGEDEKGTYFIMKGDNLPTNDPGRVRFDQIKSVVVAIIY